VHGEGAAGTDEVWSQGLIDATSAIEEEAMAARAQHPRQAAQDEMADEVYPQSMLDAITRAEQAALQARGGQ